MENETFYGDGLSCGAEVDSEGSVEGLSDIHLVILNFTFPLGILRQMKKSLRFVWEHLWASYLIFWDFCISFVAAWQFFGSPCYFHVENNPTKYKHWLV